MRLRHPLTYLGLGLLLWLAACSPQDPNEKFIQGAWMTAGDIDEGHSWYLEWTFKSGKFEVTGYPPLHQSGSYRVTASEENKLSLELYDQQGDWPTEPRSLDIIINPTDKTLTIDGQGPFTFSQSD